jgi:hypothetical protein
MPTFTIIVSVTPGTSPPTLTYSGSGSGGSTNGPKSHRVLDGTDLVFKSNDGDLLIHFKNPAGGNKRPFLPPNGGVNTIVTAAKGTTTPPLRTKVHPGKDFIRYTAVVARPGASQNLVSEDPELELGPDPGGTVTKKKAAPKTAAKKKAKK